MLQGVLIFLLLSLSLFMILLIMIQRGKGGGLAGAFGGMGGQSAFGTKAGDTFTKITVVTVLIWFTLCVSTLVILNRGFMGGGLNVEGGAERRSVPTTDSTTSLPFPDLPAGGTPSETTTPTVE